MITGMHRRRVFGWLLVLGWLLIPGAAASDGSAPSKTAMRKEDRNRLWMLVHDGCAPAAARGIYPPSPCAEVDASHGYAVFKDRVGRYQYLLLPLARIRGIESPALLAPDAPNYFADAWVARLYVETALHAAQPRDVLSLAVNSAHGRSQDQLHIHIDCIRADVHAALQRLLPTITGHWHPLSRPLPPYQHVYQAMWVDGEALSINPFKALASTLPAGESMASHSLAVVGADSPEGKPGFILLSGHAGPLHEGGGSAEELQDIDCATAIRTKP